MFKSEGETNLPILTDLVELLESEFPSYLAKEWDKTGFSLGNHKQKKITGVLLCLDLTAEAVDFALTKSANLIITRHPFIFSESYLKEISIYPYKKPLIKTIRINKLSVYSLHTNFEQKEASAAREIINQLFKGEVSRRVIFSILELPSAVVVEGEFSIKYLINLFKKNLKINSFKYLASSDITKKINRFIFLPGSWSSKDFVLEIRGRGIELVIGSEFKWSDWISFAESGETLLLEIPHIIENYFETPLIELFKEKLPSLPIYFFPAKLPFKDHNLD